MSERTFDKLSTGNEFTQSLKLMRAVAFNESFIVAQARTAALHVVGRLDAAMDMARKIRGDVKRAAELSVTAYDRGAASRRVSREYDELVNLLLMDEP